MSAKGKFMVRGQGDERAIAQLERCAEGDDVLGAALMADGHVGWSQPIGGVVAYREHLSVSGTGVDIGCGNGAVRTDIRANNLDVGPVMDEIVRRISFGMGRHNDEPVEHPVLDRIANAEFAPQRSLRTLAAAQLGTVGSGNHYVDLFRDEDGWLWVGVHFGSRGFGHKTAMGFLALAEGKDFTDRAPDTAMDSPPVLLKADSSLGQAYFAAMSLAADYAQAGRDVVIAKVLEILGSPKTTDKVHNHHNHCWRETHGGRLCKDCGGSGMQECQVGDGEWDNEECDACVGSGWIDGEDVWVVRKGATPAFPGQRGFVGATMGESAVILEGIESPLSKELLYSTVHGAGRVMSRTQAAGKIKRRKEWRCSVCGCVSRDGAVPCADHGHTSMTKQWRAEQVRPGAIDYTAVKADLAKRGIELRGGGADEAPDAYKRLDDVLAAHSETIRIVHTLEPLGVAMAGADTYDPYGD